ncbi:putative phage protein [Acetobacter orientalis]|uniref:Putative phage protein n=1 Tax=Acetobacter orientalis TaxID=146474 RepID=A0A2Z5ZKJ5_9PROT|nr:putative phage protein [Acetobacter orientalis]
MADIVSVSHALVAQMAAIVYPDGKGRPSITGRPTKIFRGWITQADYEGADCTLRRGVDFVTVIDLQGGWRRIDEPLGRPWKQGETIPSTVNLAVKGTTATVTVQVDATPAGIVGLRIRSNSAAIEDRAVAAYAVQATDTASTIAAALAAQIPNATANGATVSVPDATTIEAAVAGYSSAVRIARRQQQLFQVTIWSSSPDARDALGTALNDGMAFIDFLTDANGSTFQIECRGDWNSDTAQNNGIYMRPCRYIATYDTDVQAVMAQMLFHSAGLTPHGGDTVTTGDSRLLAVSTTISEK